MSDVERQIEQWRIDLAGSEWLGHADVRELESHLREEMGYLQAAGLADEEAFLVGRYRLGDTATLEREFAKVRPYRGVVRGLCCAILGALLYVVASNFANVTFYLLFILAHLAGLRQTGLGIMGGIAHMAGFAGPVVLAFWLYLRHSRRHAGGHARDAKIGPILTVAVLAVGVWVLRAGSGLLGFLFFRTTQPKDYAEAMRVGSLVGAGFYLLVPLVLAGLFVVLYLRTRQDVQIQR
jgi:hypothetical protein